MSPRAECTTSSLPKGDLAVMQMPGLRLGHMREITCFVFLSFFLFLWSSRRSLRPPLVQPRVGEGLVVGVGGGGLGAQGARGRGPCQTLTIKTSET